MLIRILLFTALLGFNLQAQNGDKKDAAGEKQIERVPREKIPPSPVLKPEEALKSFVLKPGFRVEIVASEPLVHDPVAMTFDPNGRIWVVEMSGYMPNYEGQGEDQPVGKIAVLEDTDGDGKMDKRTVFLDGLVMPRAVSLVRDGVLVAEPPHLWFCKDTNGDLKCDEKKEIIKDYGDQKNPEHTANGLVWALDNWIYSADWTTRLKSLPDDEWKREPTAFRGQWGISQDDAGRLVYNSNSDQYRMDLVPSQYLQRNPNFRTTTGLNFDPIRNQATWPARVTPGVNRGYRDGTLREDGTLATFTAACAPLIYRGENFPKEFYGNAFVCEPTGNLIKRNILSEENGAVTGRHAYTNSEFLASTDERFRPVNLNNGPDGALYIVDMYRGVIQHRIFLTTYLRQQSEMRGLDQPIAYGRIYRVVAENNKPSKIPQLGKMKTAELIGQLSNPNGWVRDTVQRLLVEKADSSAVPALKNLALSSDNSLARLHALWTLEGIDGLDAATLLRAFDDKNPKVKAAAIRLSEPFLKSDDKDKLLLALVKLVNDPSADVQLQLAFTLGETTSAKAEAGMALLARTASSNIYVRDALLSGLYKRELEFLQKLVANRMIESKQPGVESFLSGLAQAIFTERKTDRIASLLEIAARGKEWQRTSLLSGIAATAPASKSKNAPQPKVIRFSEEPAGFQKLRSYEDKGTVALLKKISALIAWPGQPNYVEAPKVKALSAVEQKRFDAGKELFTATCAACHQLTGQGMEGLAPPLVDSEWVLGPDKRLARIALHGVKGPISVKGKTYEMEMPGLNVLDDEQIASILTYIRREWEHGADPVSPETVKNIRESNAERMEAWTQAELQQIQ